MSGWVGSRELVDLIIIIILFYYNYYFIIIPLFPQVIAAEGEEKASRALRQAAEIMSECPAALQLRYLQTLNTMSAEKNATIIFPLPMDFMQVCKSMGPAVTAQPSAIVPNLTE